MPICRWTWRTLRWSWRRPTLAVVLCGVRDVRDDRIHSGSANMTVAGGSAFNVKAASLHLEDFTETEVRL